MKKLTLVNFAHVGCHMNITSTINYFFKILKFQKIIRVKREKINKMLKYFFYKVEGSNKLLY